MNTMIKKSMIKKKITKNRVIKNRMLRNTLSMTLLSTLVGCGLIAENNSAVNLQMINSKAADDFNQFDQREHSIDKFSEKVGYPLEGLCFYKPQGASEQQVFLLDESSMAHQMIIQQQSNDFSLLEIRQFPLPPNAEYCVVDNESQQLFINEESVGVWAYPARAESEVSRSVVDLIKPYGNLIESSGPLALVDRQLFVAEKDSHFIHQYEIQGSATKQGGVSLQKSYQLAADVKLDGLNVNREADHFILNYLDDAAEKAFQAKVLANSTDLLMKQKKQALPIINIAADAETQPVKDRGDAADDPAIWVHPQSAEKSLVIGTNKKRGLLVYNLEGQLLQQLDAGRVNNVDVRQGFTHKGQPADIAAASQRDNRSIALFNISPVDGKVSAVNEIITGLDEVYGLCMYRGLESKVYVFINDQDGRYEQYEISDSAAGWSGKRVREFRVGSQPEGCAADDNNQRLFVGEENVALWTLGAEPSADTNMDKISGITDYLQVDIEGMDLFQTETENYLLVSSQGNDSYVLFQAEAPYEYMGRFRIGLNAAIGIDGASETDGLAVSSAYLGEKYPQGLVVVQDGRNLLPNDQQNFKLVSWQKIDQEIIQ